MSTRRIYLVAIVGVLSLCVVSFLIASVDFEVTSRQTLPEITRQFVSRVTVVGTLLYLVTIIRLVIDWISNMQQWRIASYTAAVILIVGLYVLGGILLRLEKSSDNRN